MADNTVLNGVSVGGGDTVASDEVGGVKHQLVKIEFGVGGAATKVSTTNPLPTLSPAVSAVESSKAASASSIELAAANTTRQCLVIRNDSTAILYVSFGVPASTSSPIRLTAQDLYEMNARYTGAVNGIWDTATGSARIAEFS